MAISASSPKASDKLTEWPILGHKARAIKTAVVTEFYKLHTEFRINLMLVALWLAG